MEERTRTADDAQLAAPAGELASGKIGPRAGDLRAVVLDAVTDGSADHTRPGSVLGTDQER